MKVLFLDDDNNRLNQFRQKFPSAITVETSSQCIEQLKESKIDYLFLDHDLGNQIFVDSNREDCGMEVVRWIEKNKPEIKKIILHSLNIPAVEIMFSRLINIGYDVIKVPFIMFEKYNVFKTLNSEKEV